jgi:hypothetical protein
VFDDLDRNQARDGGEPALRTTIFLLESEGETQLQSQETDQDGYFCFEAVSPGSYRVRQEKVSGYETINGQDRFVTVNAGAVAEVSFANVELATPTIEPTFTPASARPSPTLADTLTPNPTSIASSTVTPTPSITLTPSATVLTFTPTPTDTPTQTGTPEPTDTPRPTDTPKPSGTPEPTRSTTQLQP